MRKKQRRWFMWFRRRRRNAASTANRDFMLLLDGMVAICKNTDMVILAGGD